MANKFKPAGFDISLYRRPVHNKDSYGTDNIVVSDLQFRLGGDI